MSRLILKTWKKGGDRKYKIFSDLREAMDKKKEEEEFYIVRKISGTEILRKHLT